MTPLTDDDLLGLFREGDVDALQVLFARHYRAVYNFARMLLNDGHRAEDIMQETFLAVARSAHRYQPRGYFRTWVLRICRNRCLTWLDRQSRQQRILAESGFQLVESAAVPRSPDDSAMVHERREQLRRAIADLPERQREVLVLFAFEGLTYEQIAATLDIPINTVRTLLHRARARLARHFQANEGDVP